MSATRSLTWLRLMLLTVFAVGISGCDSSVAADRSEVIKPVKLFEVPEMKDKEYDAFLAEVDAGNRSHLSFQVPGVIEQLNVKQGQRVKKGELLIALDPKDFQLAVDAATAEFDFYKTNYQRDRRLFEKKLISTQTFDQSETDFRTAQANLEQAQTELGYSQIKAPYDGIISLSFVKKFQYINAKEIVLNIINTDNLDINISLPVPYVDKVGLASLQQFEFFVSFDLNRRFILPATFKEMSTQPNTDTNSYSATVAIERPGQLNILTGMTGQVFIYHEQQKQRLTLPDSAWASKENNKGSLWRYNAETRSVQLISVTLDEQGGVLSGLAAGDLIVIAGIDELQEGQVVRPWTREEGI